MRISNYSYSTITVDGKVYNKDLIIFPDWVRSDWWRKEVHNLSADDLSEVINYGPELLVVGKGSSGFMKISRATKKALRAAKIELIEADTAEAVEILNSKFKLGRKVVGAFHLTC